MVILDLVEKVGPLAEGMSVRLPAQGPDDVRLAREWCILSGNTMVVAGDDWIEIRRGRPVRAVESLPPERRPGVRLWIYTNFDCNLQCRYCCVRSSPSAARRALGHERIACVAKQAAAWGVAELWLTGGEPFILDDIGETIRACMADLPTTVLTNGMLFRGRRLRTLEALPRDGLTLQISLDSATRERHDRNRGAGSWARAVAGIRAAAERGFRVRVASTVDSSDALDEREAQMFDELLDDLGIAREDRLMRPLAHRGFADAGIDVIADMMVPEVTVTSGGVYWHPVGADDSDMLVDEEVFPLGERIDRVIELFERHAQRLNSAAMVFPCA